MCKVYIYFWTASIVKLIQPSLSLSVCMNALISVILRARDIKFDVNIPEYQTQINFILNYGL